MRKPADKRGRGRKSTTYSIPSPTKGWNTLDSIALMDSKHAVVMENYIPTSSNVALRSGSANHATGMSGRVSTLAVYNGAVSSKMFAAVGGNIYNTTTAGAVGAAVQTGKTNARWQYVNFATAGGQFLCMVNGADSYLVYDGTTWTNPTITGVSASALINISVFKNRLWFVEANSLKVWYLPVSQISGTVAALDFSSIFPSGGRLVAMGDWTLDSGNGMDDNAVFISSEGEVAVYQGTDPSTAATWRLIGIYQIGRPVGRRCLNKFASDLTIINQDGFQLMSSALSSSRVSIQSSVTDKIQPTITDSVNTYGDNFGWECSIFPSQNVIMLNVPITGGSQQFVMNTITKGWCLFTGWDAATFCTMNNELYFGTTNAVVKCFIGTSDNNLPITGKVLQAFSEMGTSNIKKFDMARPILSVDSNNVGVLLGLNVDYSTAEPTGIPSFTASTISVWDGALWDIGLWSGNLSIRKDWQTVGSLGNAGALYLKTSSSTANIKWAATNYIFQTGNGYF
jgi:hypothetical protein